VRIFGALLLPFLSLTAGAGDSYFVYFGTYTASGSKGIYAARFDPASGKVEMLGSVTEAANPSFLAIRPDRRFLYAVNWRASGTEPGNMVSAFSIDARTAKLSFLNKVPSKGEQPTHLALDSTGKTLVVANYGSGTAAAFPLAEDGRIGEAIWVDQHTGPQVEAHGGVPHAHDVLFSPDNRLLFIAELGLDRVYSYRFDAARRAISPYDPPFAATSPGSGPRHLALHPNGTFLYANNETSSSVTVFEREGGGLKEIQTISTLPPDFKGRNSTAEIQVGRTGEFLYVSNRGHDSIAVFAVESSGGRIMPVEYVSTQGKTPRNFSLDPTGDYLFAANENSSTVVLFRVDRGSGRLTPSGTVLDVPSPSCVIFLKTIVK
jgi:6-phosphogluconolactonase